MYHTHIQLKSHLISFVPVHTCEVIGAAGDVELNSPESPEGLAILQWTAPEVFSGSSSPLYYNMYYSLLAL